MKNKKFILVAIIVLTIVTSVFVFAGCKPQQVTQGDIDEIKTALATSRAALNYNISSKSPDGRNKAYVYNLTVFGNEKDASKTKAKYTATVDEIVASTNQSQFFGPSLPSNVKENKAQESDWKTFHFFEEKSFDIGDDKWETKFKIESITFEQFLAKEDIQPHTLTALLDMVQALIDANIPLEKITVKKQGIVSEYQFADIGKELCVKMGFATNDKKGVEKTAFPLVLEITKGRVSMMTDSKDDPSKTYSVAYSGPNIVMPCWDKVYE